MDLFTAIAFVAIVGAVSLVVMGIPTIIISSRAENERGRRFREEYHRSRGGRDPELEKMDRFLES